MYLDEGVDKFRLESDSQTGSPNNNDFYKPTVNIEKTNMREFITELFTLFVIPQNIAKWYILVKLEINLPIGGQFEHKTRFMNSITKLRYKIVIEDLFY